MKQKHLILYSAILLLSSSVLRGEQLVNGNFESFANGLPTGWSYVRSNSGPATIQQTGIHSPFVNVYPAGLSAVLLTNSIASNNYPQLAQNFIAISNNFTMSFEFMFAGSTTSGPWDVQLNDSTGVSPINLLVDNGGQFGLNNGLVTNNLLTLAMSQWYQVQINGSITSGLYSGSITQFGGSTTSWSNFQFGNPVADLDEVLIDRIPLAPGGSRVSLDNFSVVDAPESGTAALFCLGLLFMGRGFAKRLSHV